MRHQISKLFLQVLNFIVLCFQSILLPAKVEVQGDNKAKYSTKRCISWFTAIHPPQHKTRLLYKIFFSLLKPCMDQLFSGFTPRSSR
uniref:BRCA1-associated protein n=1 Tax=Rhizophora mucronata TaxID=61149 RepID=A0A2P2LAF9_RHIMU